MADKSPVEYFRTKGPLLPPRAVNGNRKGEGREARANAGGVFVFVMALFSAREETLLLTQKIDRREGDEMEGERAIVRLPRPEDPDLVRMEAMLAAYPDANYFYSRWNGVSEPGDEYLEGHIRESDEKRGSFFGTDNPFFTRGS